MGATPPPQRRRRRSLKPTADQTTTTPVQRSTRSSSKGHKPWSPKYKIGELRPDGDFRMTFTQELCNAMSMILPSCLIAYYWIWEPPATEDEPFWNIYSKAFAFGTLLHLPFSVAYHLLCAFDYFEDRIDCVPRKLDQTLIHVVSAILAWALSGVDLYGCGCGIVNTWFIAKLWMKGPHNTSFERRSNVIIAVVLYTFPLLWYGDVVNFAGASISFWGVAAMAFAMNRHLRGWGHSVFHAVFLPFTHFLLMAAAQVPVHLGK